MARETSPLNDAWKFALKPAQRDPEQPHFDDTTWEPVTIPHTWNAIDGQDGGADYCRGDGWYRRLFDTDPAWQGRRVFVQFDAANRVATVWVNGQLVGEHRGGYARFRFDITDRLHPAGRNVLAVRVNNEDHGIIPLRPDVDFTFHGGIYRAVCLMIVDPVHISLSDHGAPGVYLTTHNLTKESAGVEVRTLLDNHGGSAGEYGLRTLIRDAAGLVVATADEPCLPKPGETVTVVQCLHIHDPRLWEGRADPYLYTVAVELRRQDTVLDRVEQPLGLRTFQIDPQRGCLLNGRPYSLHGVCRHHDRQDKGCALSREDHREDMAFIEEIGAQAVRLAHYQHDEFFYQLADAKGLVVWAEIPFLNHVLPTEEFASNAAGQLRELIRQNYNHPSILCWGLGNETINPDPGDADRILKSLHQVARQEDPTRCTVYASNHADDDPRNFNTDLLGFNKYDGWYGYDYGVAERWLDALHARHPDRPLAFSEYGAGASIYQHEQNPPIRTITQAKGPWHPEEWQNEFHEHYWLVLKERPFVWGSFIWNLFDFAADHRLEGDTAGRNDKGLVTYDRRTRKDAFFWFKANWTTAPLVYITSRRHSLRLEAVTDIKVYSNCETVELRVNGVSLGTKSSPDRRFRWTDIALQHGPNRISVEGRTGTRCVTDSCCWTRTDGATYRPPLDADPA